MMRAFRSLLPLLAAALIAATVPGAGATQRDATASPAGPVAAVPSAPEGGPVDDGWLPGPGTSGFAQFNGEPAPAGGPVWPGVYRDARHTTLADGKNVDVQILHLDPGADVQVRPTLAGGTVRGTATVAAQSGDPLAGAVAAVNGGFWLREPYGEPNGFFAIDGHLVSDAETQGAGPRGTVGWTADGQVVIDRVDTVLTLELADGTTVEVDGINRGHREYDELFADGDHSVLAHTSFYGGPIVLAQPKQPPPPEPDPTPTDPEAPPAIPEPEPTPTPEPLDLAAVRIAVPAWPTSGAVTGVVTGLTRDHEATFEAAPGEVLITATGDGAIALDAVEMEQPITIATTASALDASRDEVWNEVVTGLAGGPMIVKNGVMTDPGDWVNEGFEPHIHSDVRAPRTAIGITPDGRVLMVTADGRRPGITHGFTIAELAQYMISLGAVEALSLDGGGSSQLVVDGILRNTPCCDSSIRQVATSLQVVHPPAFARTTRLSGAGRIDTAVAAARSSHPNGSGVVVLATSTGFADALAGGPLAALLDAPLLLTGPTALPSVTAAAISDLGVGHAVLLGGEAAIAAEVADALVAAGVTVERLAGDSRFETAAAIADRVTALGSGDGPSRVVVAPATTFPDALIAAGPGGMLGMPILLTAGDGLHPAAEAVAAGAAEVVVVDGDSVLSSTTLADLDALTGTVTAFRGGGRYAVAGEVIDWLAAQVPLSGELVVARGDDYPDALAGGPLAASRSAALMLVPPGSIDADPGAGAWFDGAVGRFDAVTVLGGLAAVGSYSQWQLEQLVTPNS